MTKDIDYLKEILEQVKKTNGTVIEHSVTIGTLKQKIKDHFHLHDALDKLSRGQATLIIATIQIIAMIIIAIIMR